MVIRVISLDSVIDYYEEKGKSTPPSIEHISDKVFKKINEEYEDGWSFPSVEAFINEFNGDGEYAPVPNEHYLRVFKD